MNIRNSQIRSQARAMLGNKIFSNCWLMAVVIFFIALAIQSHIQFASIILSGPISVGIAFVFLKLVRFGEEITLENAFNGVKKNISDNILLGLIYNVFIILWSLLFVIPGIIKSYSYSMCFYIKNDHPEYDWKKCLDESKKMMDGNKWKLFCLDLSFIGWIIVGFLCLGIGTLWVSAYINASHAIFYNELKGSDPVSESTENANDIG